eukprot:4611073-Pyramimonas_sp.AAC.2
MAMHASTATLTFHAGPRHLATQALWGPRAFAGAPETATGARGASRDGPEFSTPSAIGSWGGRRARKATAI